ncbi:MAG: hypothetical protein ACXU8U_03450 [Asticcacaulis sp.]
MHVDSSAQVAKAQIAGFLVAFESGADDGEAVALDIVEFIALRMRGRDDYQVGLLGLFIRAGLVALDRGVMAFPDVLTRMASVARAAPLGKAAFIQAVQAGLADLLF